MRKFISVLIAVFVAASLFTMSVSATDYGQDPGYTAPDAPIVSVSIVEDAIASGNFELYIEDGSDATLSLAVLAAIEAAGVPFTFIADGYSLIIDPATFTGDMRRINLSVDISIDEVDGTAGLVITPPRGNYGFDLTIAIPLDTLADFDLDNIRVYYVKDGVVIREHNDFDFANGEFLLTISGASQYIITDEVMEVAAGGSGSSFTAVDDGDDTNSKTGVAIAFTSVAISGLVAFAARKAKK